MKNQNTSKRKGGAAVGSTALLGEFLQLKLYCGILEELADSWMLSAAQKKLADLLSPDKQREALERKAADAKRTYDALFDEGRFREAADHYAEFLAIRARLDSPNNV